jgi:hypothetical protein
MNSCYLGGLYKVNFTITSHNSFQYPCEQFCPVKIPVYEITWDILGKRKKVSVRSKKQVLKKFKELGVAPLKANKIWETK